MLNLSVNKVTLKLLEGYYQPHQHTLHRLFKNHFNWCLSDAITYVRLMWT